MENHEGFEIDLLSLFYYLKKKIAIIAMVALACTVVGCVGSALFITPQYTAETRMYVLSRSDENVANSDFQIANYVLNDYKVLITGRNVTSEVIKQLNLDISPRTLESRISVTAPKDTRVLQISVADEDPQRAADIANAVREVAAVQIQEIMNVDAVNLVYTAEVPQIPSSPDVMRNTFFSAVLGAVAAIAVLTVIYAIDDTITTEEDVARHLDLSVLGVIPESADMRSLDGNHAAVSGKRRQRNAR